jgi:DNA-binding MarR family transcriptional regulator
MTIKTLNKSRRALSAHGGPGVDMQRQEWARGGGDDRGLCPVQYGWQRAAHAHTVLSILRVVRNTYFPNYRVSDVIENIYVALPVFIAHVAGKPATASQVARALEMPRNTAVRKLDWLIREGYVTRRGRKYCMTEKVNVTGLEQVMKMQARLCEVSARNLSILDIGP